MTMSSTAPAVTSTTGRGDALERAVALGLPTKRNEAWKYAPLRLLADLTFDAAVEMTGDVPADLDTQFPAIDGPRVVVVNGVVDISRSNMAVADGAVITSLADALAADSDLAAAHFARSIDTVDDTFLAYNLAFGSGGAVIDIAPGVALDTPIHIIDVETPDSTRNASCTGVAIRLGAGSSATVVETRLGLGAEFGGSNVRTTVSLGDDATLEHVLLQDVPDTQIHLSRVEVEQGAGSTFRARSFNLGASYGRVAYDVRLAGAGAHADLSGLFFGFGEQVLDQQVDVIHDAPDCTSRQSFRGVLDDKSTGVFNGGIDVRPGADGTDAEQSNDNLILSMQAEINTQPRLEILADEVACKHGATVGQLDETAMYYMRSRGIAADEARRLLINGFADQVVDDVGIESLRGWITHRLGHDDLGFEGLEAAAGEADG